jgi:hypothetical protein
MEIRNNQVRKCKTFLIKIISNFLVKRYQGQKVADAGRCEVCMTNITPHEQGVFCTALNQGCFKPYHLRCQGLTTDAYHVLSRYSHIEWVCKGCTANKLIWNVDS